MVAWSSSLSTNIPESNTAQTLAVPFRFKSVKEIEWHFIAQDACSCTTQVNLNFIPKQCLFCHLHQAGYGFVTVCLSKSQMAEWLGWVSQGFGDYAFEHRRVELVVHSTSKSFLSKKYQLQVHQSVWQPIHAQVRPLRQCGSAFISKSLMAKWLGWASQGHVIYCHYLEIMGSHPSQVEFGVHSTSVWDVHEPKTIPGQIGNISKDSAKNHHYNIFL